MLFKTPKPFLKIFDPYRGGDGGGDNDGMSVTVAIIIPRISPEDFICKGEQSVLLVKMISKKPECGCIGKIPMQYSPDMIAKIILEKLEKVERAMYDSITDGSRKALKTGPSEYLEALQQCLSGLFCGKGLLFFTQKIS